MLDYIGARIWCRALKHIYISCSCLIAQEIFNVFQIGTNVLGVILYPAFYVGGAAMHTA